MMIGSGPGGFFPVAIYARRARKALPESLLPGVCSWDILGTNLSIKVRPTLLLADLGTWVGMPQGLAATSSAGSGAAQRLLGHPGHQPVHQGAADPPPCGVLALLALARPGLRRKRSLQGQTGMKGKVVILCTALTQQCGALVVFAVLHTADCPQAQRLLHAAHGSFVSPVAVDENLWLW